MKKTHLEFLKRNDACITGLKYAERFDSLQDVWDNLQRGDWMLWLAHKLEVDQKKMCIASSLCVHTVVHLMKDKGSRDTIGAIFLYGRGKINKEDLRNYFADADAADDAAWAIADAAANSANSAADSADYAAAHATVDSAAADSAAAAAYARKRNQKRTADICRKVLSEDIVSKLNNL